jgi:hypothetical protein
MTQRGLSNQPIPAHKPAPAPFAAGSETSKAAAEAAGSRAPVQRERVLDFIRKCGERGATDDEGERALDMGTQSYTPRRGELVRLGRIVDSGRTRETRLGGTATVWIVPHVETPAAEPADSPAGPESAPLAGTPFAGWVQRPDFRGRLRWEAPNLPEAARWWAWSDFEDLPELARPIGQGAY